MTNTVRCTSSVSIPPAAATEATAAPVWVQVTQEIDAKGYGGGPFRFTSETFGQIVRNFRAHPSYVNGQSDVIAWDFHHASDMSPADVATSGAPAQGWVQDLDIRPGADGKAQLWAKTRWLEPARSYVKNWQYKWASVVVLFDARDPVTNQNVGAVLTSVALTNQPFVEGMAPLIAASRQAQGLRVAAARPMRHLVSPNSPAARQLRAQLSKQLAGQVAETEQEQRLPAKLDATSCAGRNSVERAITALRQHSPGFAKLGWDEQFTRASEAIRLGAVRA